MDGMILIDKPQSFTSFDVVAVMRGLFHQKKVGHTGTLDPMATGVLPILLGKATRCAPFLEDTNKEYQAQFQLGTATDTQDSTGNVVAVSEHKVTRQELEQVLPQFRGEILQLPPMYSAVQKESGKSVLLLFSNVNWYLSMRTHKQELCVLPALKELISVPCAMILVQRWVHME